MSEPLIEGRLLPKLRGVSMEELASGPTVDEIVRLVEENIGSRAHINKIKPDNSRMVVLTREEGVSVDGIPVIVSVNEKCFNNVHFPYGTIAPEAEVTIDCSYAVFEVSDGFRFLAGLEQATDWSEEGRNREVVDQFNAENTTILKPLDETTAREVVAMIQSLEHI